MNTTLSYNKILNKAEANKESVTSLTCLKINTEKDKKHKTV